MREIFREESGARLSASLPKRGVWRGSPAAVLRFSSWLGLSWSIFLVILGSLVSHRRRLDGSWSYGIPELSSVLAAPFLLLSQAAADVRFCWGRKNEFLMLDFWGWQGLVDSGRFTQTLWHKFLHNFVPRRGWLVLLAHVMIIPVTV